jgi:hypothetical protein
MVVLCEVSRRGAKGINEMSDIEFISRVEEKQEND